MEFKFRKPNIFEQVVFVVGILVLIVGYYLITKVLNTQGYKLTWDFLQTLFLWLLMVIFIILLAISEDIKESIMLNQIKEIRLLREALNRKR